MLLLVLACAPEPTCQAYDPSVFGVLTCETIAYCCPFRGEQLVGDCYYTERDKVFACNGASCVEAGQRVVADACRESTLPDHA